MHENSLHLPSVTFGFVLGVSVLMMVVSLFVERVVLWVVGFFLFVLLINYMMEQFNNDTT